MYETFEKQLHESGFCNNQSNLLHDENLKNMPKSVNFGQIMHRNQFAKLWAIMLYSFLLTGMFLHLQAK